MQQKISEKLTTPFKKGGLNTLTGIFVPTASSVLGTLIYVRHSIIIGESGILVTLLFWFMAVFSVYFYFLSKKFFLKILLTILSASALATNGKISGGGVYYLISRNLGPELGAVIGIISVLVFFFFLIFNISL
ncbi:MAG: hypothetical protein LBD88_04600 [Candidatus Peribacteria bacterium]|nr:hypothetical protein [Candidatus Peribacteria bacterium]